MSLLSKYSLKYSEALFFNMFRHYIICKGEFYRIVTYVNFAMIKYAVMFLICGG
jgi:hypothetical protein